MIARSLPRGSTMGRLAVIVMLLGGSLILAASIGHAAPSARPVATIGDLDHEFSDAETHMVLDPPTSSAAVDSTDAVNAAWTAMGTYAQPARVTGTLVRFNGDPEWIVSFEG